MTAPLSPVKDYVLAPPQTAGTNGSFTKTYPNSGTSISLEKGVNTCVLTWDGPAGVEVFYGPDTSWGNRRRIALIPAAAANTLRRVIVTIPADTNSYVMYLRTTPTESDLAYRAGVQIINPANI